MTPVIDRLRAITPGMVAMARQEWINRVARLADDNEPYLFLSGGVDSATILFAMLEAGLRPQCLTFQVSDWRSNDVTVASAMCRRFGLRHTVVRIAPQRLRQDVERVLCMVDWSPVARVKKTIVQCVHPFLYLLPELEAGASGFIGNNGDSFFLTRRKEQVALHQKGADYVWDWRRSYLGDPQFSDYHIVDVARRHYGISLVDLYDWPWWAWWIQHFHPDVTNRPVQKYAAVALFQDYWRMEAWYRPADRFQIGSGLRSLHDTLCDGTPHKAVIGVYNEMARAQGIVANTHPFPYNDKGHVINPDGSIYGWPSPDPLHPSTGAS